MALQLPLAFPSLRTTAAGPLAPRTPDPRRFAWATPVRMQGQRSLETPWLPPYSAPGARTWLLPPGGSSSVLQRVSHASSPHCSPRARPWLLSRQICRLLSSPRPSTSGATQHCGPHTHTPLQSQSRALARRPPGPWGPSPHPSDVLGCPQRSPQPPASRRNPDVTRGVYAVAGSHAVTTLIPSLAPSALISRLYLPSCRPATAPSSAGSSGP